MSSPFEKLLANLPYNPSLLNQLGFYARRMRREAAIRRTGLVFVVLSFFVQFFAVVTPPAATAAYSNNDMINGGISSKSEAVSTCKQNVKNYGDVLADFGISCGDVSDATTVTISSTDYNKTLYSMGWLDYGKQTNATTGKPTGEIAFNDLANVSETLYARYLWSFDTYDHSDYKALKLTSHVTGATYFILYSCGNLVAKGQPTPIPQPKPTPTPTPQTPTPTFSYPACGGLTVKGTGVRTYSFTVKIIDTGSFTIKGYTFDFGDGHTTNITSSATSASTSHTYAAPGTYNIKASAGGTITYLTGRTTIFSVSCQAAVTITNTVTQNPPITVVTPTCPYDSSLPENDSRCKPCEKAASSVDAIACVVASKTASNQTQNIANADGTTAQANDVIVYTLHAANTGKERVSQFTMQENLSDVLDYAVVKDLNGGAIDSNNVVSWPAQDIAAGAVETHTITVQVKDPIPDTPPAPSDPAHFDHIMTNVYGNAINIKLPGSIVTAVSTTTTKMPNTGPGTSLVISAIIVGLAGYFFARARLLSEESTVAVQLNTTQGGM